MPSKSHKPWTPICARHPNVEILHTILEIVLIYGARVLWRPQCDRTHPFRPGHQFRSTTRHQDLHSSLPRLSLIFFRCCQPTRLLRKRPYFPHLRERPMVLSTTNSNRRHRRDRRNRRDEPDEPRTARRAGHPDPAEPARTLTAPHPAGLRVTRPAQTAK
jgi:hypothetical protein